MKILKEDEIKSPYDLREMLWYIIPGATLLLLIFFFEFWFATQIGGINSIHNKDSTNFISNQLNQDNVADSIKKKSLDSSIILQQLHLALSDSLHTPVFSALSMTHSPLFENVKGEKSLVDNWVLAALYLLLLFTICYILGHLTYIFGTFIYERGLISKGYSYPYLKLLRLEELSRKEPEKKTPHEIRASQAFYRGLYFWSAFIFILTYILFKLFGYNNLELFRYGVLVLVIFMILFPIRLKFKLTKITYWDKKDSKLRSVVPEVKGVLYWIICGSLIAIIFLIFYWDIWHFLLTLSVLGIFIFLIEKYFQKLSRNTEIIKRIQKKWGKDEDTSTIFKIEKFYYEYLFTKWYHFFSNELDKFSNTYFHTQTEFDETFIDQYRDAFRKVYKSDYKGLINHNYWLSKFFVMENSIYLTQQINFWENIYRFTKSLSAAFFVGFLYCSLSFMLQYSLIYELISGSATKLGYKNFGELLNYNKAILVLFLLPLLYFFIKTLIVRYYLYVYDNRYNRMILRSFVSIVASQKYNKKFKK